MSRRIQPWSVSRRGRSNHTVEVIVEKFFKDKKILFIAPAFFGYEREIKKRLEALGAHVDYYDDRPSTRSWDKIAIRVMPSLVSRTVRIYFNNILARSDRDYDFVFIVKLECMPQDILVALRERNPRAKFVYYSYDSVKNNRNIRGAVHVFDSAFTFDPEDAGTLDGIRFRPLFFLNEYRNLPDVPPKYDLSFVGSAHSDRYRLVKKVKDALPGHSARTFFFLFMPNRWMCFLRRILMPTFWGASEKEFSFAPLTKEDVLSVIAASSAVLDFQHPNQTGLTMRTIEMLGARKKIITTNASVKKYEFYRPENIAVVDRKNPVIDPQFFATPYVQLPPDLYEKYSIDGWLREIFSIPVACETEDLVVEQVALPVAGVAV